MANLHIKQSDFEIFTDIAKCENIAKKKKTKNKIFSLNELRTLLWGLFSFIKNQYKIYPIPKSRVTETHRKEKRLYKL